MKNILKRFGIPAVIAASLLVMVGCLVSGTFVVIADLDDHCFTAAKHFYYYHVDLTAESEWNDHKDKIDFIDAVGFDFWITNSSSDSATFTVWLSGHTATIDTSSIQAIKDNATEVFGGLTVGAGDSVHVTYGESLGFVKNLTALKNLVKDGKFNYFGLSEGTFADDEVCWDSAKAVITVSAGN
ncbi:MAG: hypothetical protein AAB305_06850 [Candidatus Zixiibacteriota bacterium]